MDTENVCSTQDAACAAQEAARENRRRKAFCVFLFALICTSFAAAQSDEFGVSTNIAMILEFLASTSKFIGESLSDTSRFTSELGIEE